MQTVKSRVADVVVEFLRIKYEVSQANARLDIRKLVQAMEVVANKFLDIIQEEDPEIKVETSREIVQIATSMHGVTALCKDGSIWQFNPKMEAYWVKIRKIPLEIKDDKAT